MQLKIPCTAYEGKHGIEKIDISCTILSLDAAIILVYYNSGHAQMTDQVLNHDHHQKLCFILHITTTRPMHYAPDVPASHDSFDAKAM